MCLDLFLGRVADTWNGTSFEITLSRRTARSKMLRKMSTGSRKSACRLEQKLARMEPTTQEGAVEQLRDVQHLWQLAHIQGRAIQRQEEKLRDLQSQALQNFDCLVWNMWQQGLQVMSMALSHPNRYTAVEGLQGF